MQLAHNAGPYPRKIFIPARDFLELWIDLKENHRHLFPNGRVRPLTNLRVDNLHIFSAETDDPAVIRVANNMADIEYIQERGRQP
jgi:hypothetical protein